MPVTHISGFQEFFPNEQLAFESLIKIIKNNFELYGFVPLDTCVVEKSSTLLSKGNDSEIYGIYRLAGEEGNNKKDMGLRFDLTVPLARYVAKNYGNLTFPYRRYHIAPVWRGERPQAGRYRQFYQCDIDIIGDGELSQLHDGEILSVICSIFQQIKLPNFTIKINNRKLLTGIIKFCDISDNNIAAVMRVIDKIGKITSEKMKEELLDLGLSDNNADMLIDLTNRKMDNAAWIDYLDGMNISNQDFTEGLFELKEVMKNAEDFGADMNSIEITPALARGLTYYTGTVYETILNDYPELGSICGGGRYANLAENFTNKRLPGVGISIGISRLFPKLLELGLIDADKSSSADLLITAQDKECLPRYLEIGKMLRDIGVNLEIYLENKSLSSQLKYAGKKGFGFVLIANKSELENGNVTIRNMNDGEQEILKISELVEYFNGK